MNVLDLFSGIGGFSLGLERAGMRTRAFCEIDPYCRRVLAKHWPDVPIYDDVRTLTAARLAADGIVSDVADAADDRCAGRPGRGADRQGLLPSIPASGSGTTGRTSQPRRRGVDVICGGFPCQDISVAGKGAGIGGERSGLWSEYARIIDEVRPRYVIVENVAALLGRGIERVLGDLAALGYDAEWHCIPASAVGAPHRRDRVWIVAYANDRRQLQPQGSECEKRRRSGNGREEVVADADDRPLFGSAIAWPERHPWFTEPDVGRVAHGVPARVDRLRALGNAVVPQIPEIIGRAIMSVER